MVQLNNDIKLSPLFTNLEKNKKNNQKVITTTACQCYKSLIKGQLLTGQLGKGREDQAQGAESFAE